MTASKNTKRPRDTLAENINRLMKITPHLSTCTQVTARSGVTNGTLDRIRRAVVATRVDELQPLAQAFGVEPWQLLVPVEQAHATPAVGPSRSPRPRESQETHHGRHHLASGRRTAR